MRVFFVERGLVGVGESREKRVLVSWRDGLGLGLKLNRSLLYWSVCSLHTTLLLQKYLPEHKKLTQVEKIYFAVVKDVRTNFFYEYNSNILEKKIEVTIGQGG